LRNFNGFEIDDIVPSTNRNKSLSGNLSSEINSFQVLCIYNQKINPIDNGSEESLYKNIIQGNITNMPVVQNNFKSNTFIIWEQSYQENEKLFINLRLAARNNLILRIGENIVGYLIKKYEDYLGIPIKTHSKLNDKGFIDHLIQKFDSILKKDTFLNENLIWEDFCNWFRVYLTDWILEDIESSIGFSKMEKLDKSELNDLFYKSITESFSEDLEFMEKFTKIINNYTLAWIKKVMSLMGLFVLFLRHFLYLIELLAKACAHNS